jgi:hypothetical protein
MYSVSKSNITFEQVKDIEVRFLPELLRLIADFIAESDEYEKNVDNVTTQINRVLHNSHDGSLWLIWKGKKLLGFGLIELVFSAWDSFVGVIHCIYFHKSIRSRKLNELDYELGEWTKNRGGKSIYFFTRRNPQAFKRLLRRHRWEIDSTVLKRVLISV